MQPSGLSERAAAPLSAIPYAFLRWAGSKRLVLPHLVPHIPPRFATYYEPFLGSGALFFLLRPKVAALSDVCRDLVATFQAVRDDTGRVLRHLSALPPPSPAGYYEVRAHMSTGRFKRAAQFIYLNKFCWNGLYRVNALGQFNVPYGRPKSDSLGDNVNLRACGTLLRISEVTLIASDFEVVTRTARSGDFVFLDPPYATSHSRNGFVDYNEVLFSWKDQLRLASLVHKLRRRGCFVLMTNADHDSIARLYSDYRLVRFERKSTIAAQRTRRGRTTELIVVGIP